MPNAEARRRATDTDPSRKGDRGILLNWIEKVILVVLLGVGICCLLMLSWVGKINGRVDDLTVASKETTNARIENRILVCQTAIGIGVPVDRSGPCYSPELLKRYDPTAISKMERNQQEILSVICRIMRDAAARTPNPSLVNLPPQCKDVP